MSKRCDLGASGNTGGWFYQPNMVTNRARDQGNHATHKDGCLAVDAQFWCRMSHMQPFSYMLRLLVWRRMWCSRRQESLISRTFFSSTFVWLCCHRWRWTVSKMTRAWMSPLEVAINSVISQVNGSMMLGRVVPRCGVGGVSAVVVFDIVFDGVW